MVCATAEALTASAASEMWIAMEKTRFAGLRCIPRRTMPELPEVEVLRRHLAPLLLGRTIAAVHVERERVIRPTRPADLSRALLGASITGVGRRGKYLLFELRKGDQHPRLLGHLGMTGRMFLQDIHEPSPPHTAVHLDLGSDRFIYQDPRAFGRFTLDLRSLERLGPEPLSDGFQPDAFARALRQSRQAIKVKLLDQTLVTGIGNIYASEALHRAGISPRKSARRLRTAECARLHRAIRAVLEEAITCGCALPLDFSGTGSGDGLFYYGSATAREGAGEERLRVYDRENEPCITCGTPVRRIVQATRSTFYCPACQRG